MDKVYENPCSHEAYTLVEGVRQEQKSLSQMQYINVAKCQENIQAVRGYRVLPESRDSAADLHTVVS